jgi:hemerythrin
MARIEPSRLPTLPVAFMNADHAQEVQLLNDIDAALAAHVRGEGTMDTVLERLALLAVHTREHFLREEAAMREARFHATLIHKVEHDRVLSEMDREARAFRLDGDVARLSRYLFETLPGWFVLHIRTMDTVTAHAIDGG